MFYHSVSGTTTQNFKLRVSSQISR